EEHDEPPFGRCGVRGVPGVEEVAARPRWVARHRDETRELGRAASAWACRHRNVWAKGPAVLGALERHAGTARPLRRAPALWVPSWGRPCGVAEYAAHLLQEMPEARAAADCPDPRGLRVLH